MDLWDCKNISNGTNIDILRSDGRVHSAVVRSVNRNCSTVTVEWFEKGEAKGKEVDLEAVFHLNPNVNVSNIKRQDTSMSRPVLLAAQASNNKPHMSTARSSLELELLSQSLDDGSSSSSKSAGIAKDAGFVDNPDFSNVSFSLVNSSFGWIRGNGHKNPMRYSSSVKDTDRSNSKREDHCKARSSRSPKTTLEIESLTPKQEFISMINDYRNLNVSVSLKGNYQLGDCHQICVCVRKRPLNFKELKSKEVDVITIPNVNQIVIHEPKLKVDLTKYLDNQNFRFDLVFDETVDNFLVYQYTAMPLVECIFNRGMATCFAYGQTGSGKTHTMGGEFLARGLQNCSSGIYALSAKDVFKLLTTKHKDLDLFVECAYFEIYGSKVHDLLNKRQLLRVLEDRHGQVQVVGLRAERVTDVEDVLRLLQLGHGLRSSGQTSANQNSSRSHAVFQITLRQSRSGRLHGKFSLIDLAGNERGADTSSADRVTRMEGAEINKSLLALKECIRALGRRGSHRPFRASKLTQVLRDSFIGDQSRTCMISTISPGMQSCEHTLNTLRYADRVKELASDVAVGVNVTMESEGNTMAALIDLVTPTSGSGDSASSGLSKDAEEDEEDEEEDEVTVRPLRLDNEDINNQAADEKDSDEDSLFAEGNEIADPFPFSTMKKSTVQMNNSIAISPSDIHDQHEILIKIADPFPFSTMKKSTVQMNNSIAISPSDIHDQHGILIKKLGGWVDEHKLIMKSTEVENFDIMQYSTSLADILYQQISDILQLKEQIQRTRLQNNEAR